MNKKYLRDPGVSADTIVDDDDGDDEEEEEKEEV